MTSSSNPSLGKPLLAKPEFFRQEFRVGLVVYGGVSLAVYMNGVCREFYNAVRGRGIYKLIKALTDSDIVVDIISGTSAGGINGVLLSYALTNSDEKIAVDFGNFADIWRESGDISQLLRQPAQKDINSVLDGEGYYQDRLAEAFQKAWEQKISARKDEKSFKDEWFSDAEELDLFVTGTDVLGKVYQAFDNTGRVIEVKDHRTVFLLKHRRARKHPFKPCQETNQSLATLCRITSCFPVAFPVVSVKLPPSSDCDPKIKEISKRLVAWGQLTNRELPKEEPEDGYQLHFVDGGVLDNRPFSYTIEQIYQRTAYRPVERKLFYIDPSPDQFLGSPKFDRMAKPSIWESALDSLVSMPRYESIANDLKEINARNEKVRRYKLLRGTAERLAEKRAGQKETPSPQTKSNSPNSTPEQIYLRCRLEGLRDRILPLILRIDQATTAQQNYQRYPNTQALLESAAELITKYISDKKQQEERESFLHDLGTQIRNLDVDYALRKHFFLSEKIFQFMADPQYQDTSKYPDLIHSLEQLARSLCRQVELLEIVQTALERMLQSEPVSRTFYALLNQAKEEESANVRRVMRPYVYDYLLRLHRFLLDADGLTDFDPDRDRLIPGNSSYLVDEPDEKEDPVVIPIDFFQHLPSPISSIQISSVLLQIKKKIKLLDFAKLGLKPSTLIGEDDQLDLEQTGSIWKDDKYKFVEGSENDSPTYSSILRKVELATETLIQSCNVSQALELLNSFRSFRYIDEEVYSYELLSDIQAKEQIEIFRISPQDAQLGFSRRKSEEKLAGAQLGAFGGFFKKTWRSNDILWGRLDGLNRILEALLTQESLQNFSYFLDRQLENIQTNGDKKLARKKYIDCLVEEAFPTVTSSEKDDIKKALEKLDGGERLQDDRLTNFREMLVTAAHREILQSDLKNVLDDSIADQLTWGQQLVPPELGKLEYQPVKIPSSPKGLQELGLQGVNNLLVCLLKSCTQPNIGMLLASLAGQKDLTGYLDELFGNAFPSSQQSDRQVLIRYLLNFVKTSRVPIYDLNRFLSQLVQLGKSEIQGKDPAHSSEIVREIGEINAQLDKVMQKLTESLKPKFDATAGYLDKAITPFAVSELVKAPIQEILTDPDKTEHYFRDRYQVGSEKLTKDIPPIILEDLAARTGLVLQNILQSPPSGQYLNKLNSFKLASFLIQSFNLWVQAKNPKTSFIPVSWRSRLSLLVSIVAIVGIAFLVSNLPVPLLISIVTLVILQLLNSLRVRIK